MRPSRRHLLIAAIAAVSLSFLTAVGTTTKRRGSGARPERGTDADILQHARKALDEGRTTFRYDTFGDEAFWGDTLRLHQAIAGARTAASARASRPETALAVGLKVDVDALPATLQQAIAGAARSTSTIRRRRWRC